MGETDRFHKGDYKFRRRRFSLGASGNAIMTLFAVNVIFFLVLMVIKIGMFVDEQTPAYFTSHVMQWFEMPASLTRLTERPWTLLTYMFTDTGDGLFRAISNMVWLWMFGSVLQEMAGNDKIIPIYIYGGVTGALSA
jgi:membrane associated rhomboid family serine protease